MTCAEKWQVPGAAPHHPSQTQGIGWGPYPLIALAEASEQATENLRIARTGRDPLEEKRAACNILTFKEAALKAHAEFAPTFKTPKDAAAFLTSLETYVFPHIGSIPLPEVTSADVRRAILAAHKQVPGVARKLVYRISRAFKRSIAEGICTGNPAKPEALALPAMERGS